MIINIVNTYRERERERERKKEKESVCMNFIKFSCGKIIIKIQDNFLFEKQEN